MEIPLVYSYISGGDYENPVQFADSVMIIALDSYLGSDFKPYLADGVSLYQAQRMTPEHIVPDCMRSFVNRLAPSNMSSGTFLDQIVDAGKRLYLLDAFIPGISGNLKINYTPGQFSWISKTNLMSGQPLLRTGCSIHPMDRPFVLSCQTVPLHLPSEKNHLLVWENGLAGRL